MARLAHKFKCQKEAEKSLMDSEMERPRKREGMANRLPSCRVVSTSKERMGGVFIYGK